MNEYTNKSNNKEPDGKSILSRLLYFMYRAGLFKKLTYKAILATEGGELYSPTMRIILKNNVNLSIGKYSYGSCIRDGALPEGTEVGRYCSFASGLRIFRRNHPASRASMHPFFYNSELQMVKSDTIISNRDNALSIGNDVWVGDRVTILPGCKTIGNGAVIGANAVVTKDVPAYSVVGGNPATLRKVRFSEEVQKILEESKWWELDISDLENIIDLFTTDINVNVATKILHHCNTIKR